jgi:hypothetical protein
MKLQLKSAEQAQRGLKEEMAKMRVLVQQTRKECAVEVRKRERVVEGLKKHVGDGRVRGGGKMAGVREVVIVPGVGAEANPAASSGSVSVGEEGYDLRSETNEFLTELARGLSEENEHLASLARRTVDTLKTLSGLEKESQENNMVVIENSYENLSQETEAVLEHVRNLLTNPSFVPLEEVEMREEEIIRLREGWERMESRWREAVQMMDGWRKRMARSGQTVNLEELKMGLMLSPLKPKEENGQFQLSILVEEGEGDTQADIDAMSEMGEPVEQDFEDSDSSLFEEDPVDEEMEEEEPNSSVNTAESTSPVPDPPQLSPLKESCGNRATTVREAEREGFSTIVEENTFDLLQLANSPPKERSAKSTPTPLPRSQNTNLKQNLTPPEESHPIIKPVSQPRQRSISPQKVAQTPKPAPTPRLRTDNTSRLPRPRDNKDIQSMQSPLTMASIAAKLAASEREADAARVRAKIKAARAGRITAATAGQTSGNTNSKDMPPPPSTYTGTQDNKVQAEDMEVENEIGARGKKRKARDDGRKGRVNRRRSTLSPWELESLILGGAGTASPEK